MVSLTVFGKNLEVVEEKSSRDSVKLKDGKLHVTVFEKPADLLLKEFLEDLLYSELLRVYKEIRRGGKVEVFGNLDFEVVEKIDNKKNRVAKLKGNKILVKFNAVALPRKVLKYVIAHEIAHLFTKRHTKRFWKTVKLMCPNFKESQKLLVEYVDLITGELIRENQTSFHLH